MLARLSSLVMSSMSTLLSHLPPFMLLWTQLKVAPGPCSGSYNCLLSRVFCVQRSGPCDLRAYILCKSVVILGKHHLQVRKVSLGMQSLVGTSRHSRSETGRKWAWSSSKVGQTGPKGPLSFFLILRFWRISSTDRIKVIPKGVFIWERNVNLEVFLI